MRAPAQPATRLHPHAGWAAAAGALGLAAGWTASRWGDLFRVEAASPLLLLALVAGGIAVGLLAARPSVALVLVVAFVYLHLSEVLVREHALPSFLRLLFVPLAGAALLAAGREGLARLALQPVPWAVAAWLAAGMLAARRAVDPALAQADLVELGRGLLLLVTVALLSAHPRRLRLALGATVAAGTLLAAGALLQVGTDFAVGDLGGLARIKHAQIYGNVFEPRVAGPLGDPNFFAQVLLPLVPLALAMAREGTRLVPRLLALLAGAILVGGIVVTYSRGAVVALAVVAALMPFAMRLRKRQVVAIGALLIAPMLLLPGLPSRLSTLRQVLPGGGDVLRPDSSFEKRRLVTRTAWEMFLEHPALGVGPGNYAARFAELAPRVGSRAREYDEPGEPQYPHNLFLEVAAETGIVGLLAFAAVAVTLFGSAARAAARFRGRGEERASRLVAALAVGLVGYFTCSVFLHGHFQRYLWLLAGLVVACDLVARRPEDA